MKSVFFQRNLVQLAKVLGIDIKRSYLHCAELIFVDFETFFFDYQFCALKHELNTELIFLQMLFCDFCGLPRNESLVSFRFPKYDLYIYRFLKLSFRCDVPTFTELKR